MKIWRQFFKLNLKGKILFQTRKETRRNEEIVRKYVKAELYLELSRASMMKLFAKKLTASSYCRTKLKLPTKDNHRL